MSLRSSLLAAALMLPGAPARAPAIGVPGRDAGKALAHGIAFLKRVLHVTQGSEVVSHSIAFSRNEATLELDLAGGGKRAISLKSGDVLVDGRRVGRYRQSGDLDRSWRRVLAEGGASDVHGLLIALRAWRPAGLKGADAAARAQLGLALHGLVDAEPAAASASAAREQVGGGRRSAGAAHPKAVTITGEDLATLDTMRRQVAGLDDLGPDIAAAVRSGVHLGDYSVPAGEHEGGDVVVFKGKADIFGDVAGNVVALYGDVVYHRGATIGKSAVSIGGQVIDDGGTVRGDIKTVSADRLEVGPPPGEEEQATESAVPGPGRAAPAAWQQLRGDVLTVVGVFVALAMIGFGTVFFGRRYVEVVADTASNSFGRSLVVGLLGQLLVLPTFGMLIVGLVLTVVGILLLPFAAVAFVIGALAAVLGGYLAVAHAVGETVARRRMAHGAFVRWPHAYGYLFTGLVGLLGLWAAAALFGWAGPVVILFRLAAVVVTWLAATVGFGAVLLSRGGLRETFAGRHVGELSDEYLWATPPATPAAPRQHSKE